ncbi:Hypothetical protein PHPALM_20509 [Phytophthora palmivora]|uniref:Reverse transcriptase domain-containing protein n=1 Tax=Phytophthora palmivora TaxID=4796 RepID=A0A2P4XEP8_9STRA|nr:Hypothetical protein PHPALM_20509 [Phytophthora palmivora]
MSDLQADLEVVKGAIFFGLYWQIALAEECQEILSYMTHQKVYTPRRVPQGCTDAALFFQATIEKCLEELLHRHFLVWIDDLLLFATDVQTYLTKLERLFELLDFFGFKLSVKISRLFKHEVRWCGKIISGSGVRHDPERVRALQDLPYQRTTGELQQFLCASNWMRDSLIDFSRVSRPLQDALETALATTARRTKRIAAGIEIRLTQEQLASYDELKQLLATSVELAFPCENLQHA